MISCINIHSFEKVEIKHDILSHFAPMIADRRVRTTPSMEVDPPLMTIISSLFRQ